MTDVGEDASGYFDGQTDREWARLERTLHGRVKYAIHRKLLLDYLRPGTCATWNSMMSRSI